MTLPVLDCRTCGACCTYCGAPPYAMREIVAMGERLMALRLWLANIMVSAKPNTSCAAYDADAKRCTIYEDRPKVCREFEIGGSACLNARRRAGL